MKISESFDEFKIVNATIKTVDQKAKTRTLAVEYKGKKGDDVFLKEVALRNMKTIPLNPIGFHLEETFPIEGKVSQPFGFVQTFKKQSVPSSPKEKRGLEINHLQSTIPEKLFLPKGYEHAKKE